MGVSGGTELRSIIVLRSALGRDSGQSLLLKGVVWVPAGDAVPARSLVRRQRGQEQRIS